MSVSAIQGSSQAIIPADPRGQGVNGFWTSNVVHDPFLVSIFPKLTYDEVTKVFLVCTKWNQWVEEMFPQVLSKLNVRLLSRQAIEAELKKAMPEEMFAKLSFEMIPETIDFREALNKSFRFLADIKAAGTAVEDDEGLTIVAALPQGVTLKMLVAAYKNRFRFIVSSILEVLGGKESEGGQFMITNNVLENTRNKPYVTKKSFCKKAGGDLPGITNGIFYALMTEKILSIRPFNNDKKVTYTRSSDEIDGVPLSFGGFAPVGLAFDSYNFDFDDYGGSALRKF